MLLLSFHVYSQATIQEILAKRGSYAKVTQLADEYFKAKHPGKSKSDMSSGEFRDGKYVKYERWKSYWKDHLNDDGTLGDPTAFFSAIKRSDKILILKPFKRFMFKYTAPGRISKTVKTVTQGFT
ncbi:MAG: hypothetical protein H6577_14195 [Lewinellaceae bacterium]|nr:hypothetical protein [Saprospiraceae bacterium]MCB9339279.1 hypothetical protein [Lewinellaceae bacterium]